MMLQLFFVLFLTTSINCFPETVNIPRNVSPSEVNQLVEPLKTSHIDAQPNILEDTVREVEATLKANPKLPRLTRGEILDLLENITKNDPNSLIEKHERNHLRSSNKRNPKAIMKVLPFTPDINGLNVEDLYTKPPITQIVGSRNQGKEENSATVLNLPETIQHTTAKPIKKSANDKIKKYRGNQRYSNNYSTLSPATSTTPPNTEPPTTTTKSHNTNCGGRESFRCNPSSFKQNEPQTSTQRITKKRRPVNFKRTRTSTTSTTSKYSNHRYDDEVPEESSLSTISTLFPSNGIKIISSPFLPPKIINEDLLAQDGEVKEVFVKKEIPVSYTVIDLNVGDDSKNEKEIPPLVVSRPEYSQDAFGDRNVETILKDIPKKQHTLNKSSSKSITKSPPKSTATNHILEEPDIKQMLLSLGIIGDQIPADITIFPTTTTSTTTSTSSPMPDIDNVVDTLTPEMKALLMNVGLIPNSNNSSKSSSNNQVYYDNYNPEKAEVKPESYVGFKPLPDDENSRDEMKELLARFGLGRNAKNKKSLNYNENTGNKMDLPNEYQMILKNIGLEGDSEAESSDTVTNQHVFNPSENLYATKEEIEKLNNLSTAVKNLETLNRPITTEDFKTIDVETLKTLVASLNNSVVPLDQQNAPDPLGFDYELIKNEIKREENVTADERKKDLFDNTNNTNSNTTKTTEITVSTSTSSSIAESALKEETVTPNIKDLEDSFGGQTETVAETTTEKSKAEQTGFYYLLDWNTFFDIDDQKGKRVNLRLQPKVGNPKRFYSVSVP